MEHFLLPKDPSSPPVKVPYVCQEPYDGGPFLEYPIRKNKPWIIPNPTSPRYMPYKIWETLHPTPAREQEAFLQTWLFFGLIQTFQGDTFNQDDYIVTDSIDPEVRYISTSKMLPNLKEARRLRTIENPNADKQKQLENSTKYLRLAMEVSQAIREDFDWRIRLSIVSVCETLAHSVWASFLFMGIKGPHTAGFYYDFYNEEIRADMRRNGWCPCDIARVANQAQYFQTLYFVSKIKKLNSGMNHGLCTPDLCVLYQTSREAYRTKHRLQGCDCPDVTIDLKAAIEILRRGNIPLLKTVEIKGQVGEFCIEVVESTKDTPYVPISHVWKDGMGNPNGNYLPKCQIRHIGTLVNQLKPKLFPEPPREPLLFWIDTLCCPVEPLDDKLLAISMLRKTYSDAIAVLVMDAGLQLCDHLELHGVEILARLYTSGWMYRLWTLQEGGLAKRLFFQFKHGAIDLEKQYKEVETAIPRDVRLLGPYYDLKAQQAAVMQFLSPSSEAGDDWHKIGAHLRRIDTALQNRSTTVDSDEPLCLATLLNLEIDFKKVPETLSSRMCRIWESLAAKYNGLPQKMIFLEHSKLTVPGFQWAPTSLLHAGYADKFRPQTRLSFWGDPRLGQINPRGFLVEFPGFKLEWLPPTERNPGKSLRVLTEAGATFSSSDGTLYHIGLIGKNANKIVKGGQQVIYDLICKGSCAVLIDESLTQRSRENKRVQGLLVDIKENDGRILYGQNKYHIVFFEAFPGMKMAMMNARRLAQVLREDPASKLAINLMSNEQSTEYIAAVSSLEARAKDIAKDALRDVPGLSEAVSDSFGGDESLGGYWVLVTHAYRYGSFGCIQLPDDQKWCLE